MRKFILIASLLLVSGTAQAEQMRGLTLASSEAPAQQSQTVAPAQQQAAAREQPGRDAKAAATPDRYDDRDGYRDDDRRDSRRNRDSARDDDRYDRKPVRHHESSEHKARRIAAKYGIYW